MQHLFLQVKDFKQSNYYYKEDYYEKIYNMHFSIEYNGNL